MYTFGAGQYTHKIGTINTILLSVIKRVPIVPKFFFAQIIPCAGHKV